MLPVDDKDVEGVALLIKQGHKALAAVKHADNLYAEVTGIVKDELARVGDHMAA